MGFVLPLHRTTRRHDPALFCAPSATVILFQVAGGIVIKLRGLGLADLVDGARHNHLLAPRPRRHGKTERAKGEPTKIFAEHGTGPGLAAVSRHFDLANAVARVPCDTANLEIA